MSIRNLISAVGVCISLSCAARAQDIAGNWQGTLKARGQELRIVLQIAQDGAGWKVDTYNIDQIPEPVVASSISLDGGTLKFSLDSQVPSPAAYEGKLSADGNSIVGTFTQGRPLPLEFTRATPETGWTIPDRPKHSIQFITVDKDAGNDVRLEVLDWGGSGPPMVFLTGLGNNAHVFDKFAPKFIDRYHVYGITRRGFGKSSVPTRGYEADRLGDDVLAVIDALKLNKPVLVGHSIAGEELSSIGSRHPEKVAGLVYLDAGYWYAFYDSRTPNPGMDLSDVHGKLERLMTQPADRNTLIKQLLESDLPQLTKELKQMQKQSAATTAAELIVQSGALTYPPTGRAIIFGSQKYIKIPVPILAIYAVPQDVGPQGVPAPLTSELYDAAIDAQATAFEKSVPTAHIVRIPHASHVVYNSNEADVLREMNSFLSTLKRD
jgi:pimeloyl-ACP methyl ester carboxylesterase